MILADGDSTDITGYNLFLYQNHAQFILNVGGWNSCWAHGTTNVYDNSWHYLVGTFAGAGGAAKIYVDGALQASSYRCPNQATNYGTSPAGEIGWKLKHQNNDDFSGAIDEARVSPTALSPDWIATEYNNQGLHQPSTVLSPGRFLQASRVRAARILLWAQLGPSPSS
jgi:hypothetical protein